MITKNRTCLISHLTALFLGLFFYTSIGLLFIVPNVPLRVIVFLFLLLLAEFKKQHCFIIIVSCVIGMLISPIQDSGLVLSNVLSWGGLTGSVIGSLLIYKDVFTGGDFASISRFFKNKNTVAIHAYYAFKLIPMISDLLDRITKAFMVYGKRKYTKEKKTLISKIAVDAVDSLFSEMLQIMFSQVRVMDRREKVAHLVSQQKRTIRLRLLVIQLMIIFSVFAFLGVRLIFDEINLVNFPKPFIFSIRF